MKNNSLIVKEESIFSKIVGFFKRLFGKEEVVVAPIVEEKISEEKKVSNRESDFLSYIQIDKKENPELMELQRKFEAKEILMSEMSNEQLIELTALYNRQTNELKREIENKKTRIGMLKFKLTGQIPGM